MTQTLNVMQIGQVALRAPDGSCMPAVPIYIQADDGGKINPATGNTVREDASFDDVSKVFAENFRKYKRGCKNHE